MSLSSPPTITLLSLAGTSQGDNNVHTLSPWVACLLLLLPVVGVTITRYVMCPRASTRDRGCQLTLTVVSLTCATITLLGAEGAVVREGALQPINIKMEIGTSIYKHSCVYSTISQLWQLLQGKSYCFSALNALLANMSLVLQFLAFPQYVASSKHYKWLVHRYTCICYISAMSQQVKSVRPHCY